MLEILYTPLTRGSIAAAFALLCLGACTAAAPSGSGSPDGVRIVAGGSSDDPLVGIREAWLAAHGAGDAEALAGYFAEDAVLLPSGAAAVEGRPAIREYLAADFASGATSVTVVSSMVRIHGDLAVEWAEYEARPTASPDDAGRRGKYVMAYQRRADGTWQIQLDTWNADS